MVGKNWQVSDMQLVVPLTVFLNLIISLRICPISVILIVIRS